MVKFKTSPLGVRLVLLLSGWSCTMLLIMTESKLSFAVTSILSLILLGDALFPQPRRVLVAQIDLGL